MENAADAPAAKRVKEEDGSHVPKRQKPGRFPCGVCGKLFQSQSAVVTHGAVHTGARNFTCEQCGKQYNTKGYLTTHIRIHTGEKPYACELCPKAFINASHLTRHGRTHAKEKTAGL